MSSMVQIKLDENIEIVSHADIAVITLQGIEHVQRSHATASPVDNLMFSGIPGDRRKWRGK